jgi:hypothetical protein
MKSFKQYLGPEATKQQDAAEIARQKKHLDDKAKEYYDQAEREGGHAAAFAKGITMALAKKNIKESNKSNPFTRVDLDKIAKSKKREEKEKGLLRKPGSSMTKNTMNYIDKVDKLSENDESINEDLRKWFKQKWVRMDTKGNIKGDCAREPGEGKPKCLPQAKAHALGKEGRASAAQRKRREDPNPERRGAPINVRTEEVDEACWTGYTAKGMKKKGNRMVPNCVPEEVEQIDEKNVPTSPEKWARAKAAAKSKFAVYPSAYANGWASKKYKSMGGGWKATSEETVQEDGAGGVAAAPTNVVGGGAIAGSGGAGGEPGVSKKRNPVMSFFKRKQPKM